MRDRSTTNWFGENIDEQEKRRQWLEKVYDDASKNENVNQKSSLFSQPDNNIFEQVKKTYDQTYQLSNKLNNDNSINNDKYKHSYISCKAAQQGLTGALTVGAMGLAKEGKDLILKSKNYIKGNSPYTNYYDILKDGKNDLIANAKGILSGYKNPNDDCDELISKYYPRYIK